MQKGINNRSKIDAKSNPERRVPKGAKMKQKGPPPCFPDQENQAPATDRNSLRNNYFLTAAVPINWIY